VVQPSDTSMLIFSIPRLIEYTSTIFDLVPGDVVEVEIENIAVLRNPIVDE
jgi:2-keto-4-pentenoate hydratase/2-oxohepta-3-ene-1,7-dioic acid hydratase in catechol pathway